LALGEAWRAAGGDTAVLVPGDRHEALERVREAAATSVEAPAGVPVSPVTIADAAVGRAWCVLDGYDLGIDHHRAATAAAHVAVIDDHGCSGAVGVDVVIDHNPGATTEPSRNGGARVLAGAPYTLLRAEHRPSSNQAEPDRLVIVMGGSPDGATTEFVHEVLAALDVPDDRIDLVGLAMPAFSSSGDLRIVDRDESLAPVFRDARVALSAAGSTTWELAVAGTATVLVSIAPNQVPVGEAAAAAGAARYLGVRDEVAPAEVAAALNELWVDRAAATAMAARGRSMVDGLGPTRVVAALRSVTVPLRPAVMGDARQLWTWANDRHVREMAFDSEPITWTDHVEWLRRRLVDGGSRIYLADDGVTGAWGQVRFDPVGDGEVVTDVSIDPNRRGQGLGAPLLVAATARLSEDCVGLGQVTARIKGINRASVRAFAGAGFRQVGDDDGVFTFEWTP
jgi:spore coat polysaccharide biosynthesis predicted glycosyltransferase SpsG/L-amino acid N-acyltransferase YncA